jgi:hypothetical protein
MRDDHWTHYGRRRLADAITNGEPLPDAFNELGHQIASTAGLSAFVGFLAASLETLDRLRAAGFKFSGDPILTRTGQAAALELTGDIERRDWAALEGKCCLLITALEACRDWLAVQQPVPPKRAAVAEPAPVPVRIVGMPERVTETLIERDAKGNIAASTQIERDAA